MCGEGALLNQGRRGARGGQAGGQSSRERELVLGKKEKRRGGGGLVDAQGRPNDMPLRPVRPPPLMPLIPCSADSPLPPPLAALPCCWCCCAAAAVKSKCLESLVVVVWVGGCGGASG